MVLLFSENWKNYASIHFSLFKPSERMWCLFEKTRQVQQYIV